MKRQYFILVTLLFFAISNAQIVNIPDANFKAKLLEASATQSIASGGTPDSSGNVPVYGKVDTNGDGEIQVTEAAAIKYLNLATNYTIANLEGINSFVNLQTLRCAYNRLTSLDVTALTNLKWLYCDSNDLTSLNVSGMTNLQVLNCSQNELANVNLSGLTNLKNIVCVRNVLTSLDLTGLTSLTNVECYDNHLTNLNVSDLPNLVGLYCYDNQFTNLNVSNLPSLSTLNCRSNQLTTLDVGSLNSLKTLICAENRLTTLFIKNNNTSWTSLTFSNNPNLVYICADDADVNSVQQNVNTLGYTNCQVNSYCNFTPGGVFYTIQGEKKIDGDTNGCDASDAAYPYLKFNIVSGANSGTLISNATENYSITVPAGTHTITPNFENSAYFTASPASATVSFPSAATPFAQHFCISPNGVHHDLETVMFLISNDVRPGIHVRYKIKYKNKGNMTENATVNLSYDDQRLVYVSSSLAATQSSNLLSWNLGNLAPFQSGEIVFELDIHSPLDFPPVNMGDTLHFVASIDGLNTDETPEDNTSVINQRVVNSFDPNDKTCLEGSVLSPDLIGKYVHYKIRFENTGTASALNIVVKDMIDTTKFDIATLQLIDASHSCVTKINNQGKVEFIFENINLPFEDLINDGYLIFKIKTKSTLQVNSTISNSASIYFDYNFPVVTDPAISTFDALTNNTFEFDAYLTIYPNPVGEFLNLTTKQDIQISSVVIYNTVGQQVQTTTDPSQKVDVSSLKTGNYILKVVTNKGISSSKFIKQ